MYVYNIYNIQVPVLLIFPGQKNFANLSLVVSNNRSVGSTRAMHGTLFRTSVYDNSLEMNTFRTCHMYVFDRSIARRVFGKKSC